MTETVPTIGDGPPEPAAAAPAEPAVVYDERATLLSCYAAGFATLLDGAVIAFAAPAAQSALALPDSGVQWFLASFSLTFGLGLAPAGRLGDAYGRRGLFIAGLALFLIGGVGSAVATGAWTVIGGRLVQGFGAGMISAQVLAVIQDAFTGPARLRALAGYTAAGASAAIAGPLLAGGVLWLLPSEIAWRIILLLPIPFTVAAIVLGVRGLPGAPRTRRAVDLDLPGIAALGLLVVIVTIPVIDPGLPAVAIAAILAASALLVTGLIGWERRYARHGRLPLFAPQLMRSRGYVIGNAVAALWFGSVLAFVTIKTIYFLQVCDIPALALAVALIPSALARIVAARWGQRLFVTHGPALVTYGLVAQTVCLAASAAATLRWDGWALFVVISALQIISGLSGGVVEPPLRAVTLAFSPPALHGVAASFLQLTQRLSATFCIALTTGVLLAFGPSASAASLRWALLLCGAAAALATALSFARYFRAGPPTPAVAARSDDETLTRPL
ncbi:MFS transporter [Nocardia yamanashiensis]|uniref:MFS transporter n=1 Tax=Nocardia yamanashiensis TaxID=209247 RepID=UPI001E655BAC|nr:MFS transporter [Nocardia yamanashiensis]UGT41757.1 MFS transporter [Nocardia yamanashiensis]